MRKLITEPRVRPSGARCRGVFLGKVEKVFLVSPRPSRVPPAESMWKRAISRTREGGGIQRTRKRASSCRAEEVEGERGREREIGGKHSPLPLICKTWYRFGDYLGLSKSISGKHDIRHPLNLSQKLVGLLISFKQGRRSKDGKMKSKWQISSVSFLRRYLDLQNLLIFVILRHL